MADSEVDHREAHEELVNPSDGKPDRLGPSSTQTFSRPSSPSLSISASEAAATNSIPDGKSSNYFAALEASVEGLQSHAQSLIDKINERRSKDQAIMKSFNTNLTTKVAEVTQCLEDRMYQLYEQNNTLLQVRLQELTGLIDRIGQLQAELKKVCQTVVTIYKDMCLQPEI
ncbi:synaptonemal complex central element protein 2 [Pseudophryne corroboree]|uniref:synaptonemal complex central element protein 2 n=1 Tax=Pseudophryne corroboree TaxID=495146 RepID=UPI003081D4B9